ncbi:signal peptidase II [Candidatus Peregrinibacteria bacterium]|nr:signal peptidase II [Candidatus Peregrinibacteria bacterium]
MKKTFIQIALIASILAFFDQLSKYYAEKYLPGSPQTLFTDFFQLEYSQNPGIAFGIPVPQLLLIVTTVVLIGVVAFFAYKELNLKSKLAIFATAMIIGGALGNLIDRFTHGYVIDFISISHWPNFNLADLYISTAVLLILIFYGKIKGVKN